MMCSRKNFWKFK